MRRAHEHRVVLHKQIAPFDEFDTHLLREEGVLEIGAVIGAGCQHHHGRIFHIARRDGAQILQQHVRIVFHRGDFVTREQLREKPHHHLAVFDHVRHAGRYPQVVFQHVVFTRVSPDQIDAGDMGIDAGRYVQSFHLGAELSVVEHLLGWNALGLEDVLIVIDIVQESIERLDPLTQPLLQLPPFLRRDDAGNDIEGNQTFLASFLPIDSESDPHAMKGDIRLGAFAGDTFCRRIGQPFGVGLEMRTNFSRVIVHLIEECRFHVPCRCGCVQN